MQQQAMSHYQGLRDALEERCTILGMKLPQLVTDTNAAANGFKVSRPFVDQVKVVIRMQGMWMLIDISVVREVIRSVMTVIREWCAQALGNCELEEVPNWDEKAFSFA